MMKLSDVGRVFDTMTILDASGKTRPVKGRILPYDDNSRDSLSADRRILSMVPGTAIPARRVIHAAGEYWIVGQVTADFHGDEPLRQKYVLHRVDGVARVATFEQAISGVGGVTAHVGRLWMKDMKEPEESSSLYESLHFYLSTTEDIRDQSKLTGPFLDGEETHVLIHFKSKWHLVRNTFESAGGFQVAVVDELPDPVAIAATINSTVYDKLADKKVATGKTVQALSLRWQSQYTYLSSYSTKYEEGDRVLMVLKSDTTPTVADTVTLRGRTFKVVTVLDQANVWALHLRHV
jgi:hypothetical protein